MALLVNRDVGSKSFLSHYDVERPVSWMQRFGTTAPLEVEIGSGLGEYLVRLAQAHPERHFVGIEQEWERVKKILRRIDAVNRVSAHLLENIRVLQIDATVAFERLFFPESIDRVHCLFPCPWPKKKHVKHRLFSRSFLALVNSRVKESGTLKLVTDHQPYAQWVLEELTDTGWEVSSSEIDPQFDTKFERKWLAQGQEKFFKLELVKVEHISIPLKEDVQLKVYFAKNFDPRRFGGPKGPTNPRGRAAQPAIVFKDFLFDDRQKKGVAHLVVQEESITQHVWVMISACSRGWCIAKMEGQTLLPTQGVAEAIHLVYQWVQQSGEE